MNKVHLSYREHNIFCERFLSDKQKDFLPSPCITFEEEKKLENNEESSKSEPSIKKEASTTPENNKLLKFRSHVMEALKNKKNQDLKKERKKSIAFSKGTTIYSTSRKIDSKVKSYENLKNLPPVVNNNIKMFFTKTKRMGYLNDLSVLKQYELNIINDHAYYEPEVEENSLNFQKFCSVFALYLNRIFRNVLKRFHIKETPRLIIHPYNKFKLLWDLLISLMVIFLLFYIPLSLSFGLSLLKDQEKSVIAVFLSIDMLLESNTLYFNYGLEVQNRKKIIKNYLRSYFFPDFLALFSIFFQISYFQDLIGNEAFALVFFLKIFALKKVSKKITNRFQFSHEWKGIKDLAALFFVIILIAHISACGWHYIGVLKTNDINSSSWIIKQGIMNENWYIHYMTSFYWSIVTVMTVGYGDIIPENYIERCYCLLVILFGGMIFPYSINYIGLIIQDIQREKIKFKLDFF